MSFLDRIRKALAGPPHVKAGDDEEAAALHEEFGAPDEGEADVTRLEETGGGDLQYMEETGGGGGEVGLRFGASEAAEAGLDDLESEEAPPDP